MRRSALPLWIAPLVLALAPPNWEPSVRDALLPDEPTARAPFSLELPDLGGLRITLPVAAIPAADLRTLRLNISNPYADRINYGKIYTAINGEAANTIQSIRTGLSGKVVTCDLESKPRFHLQPGKNVVEITAIDQDKRTFYASYVLIVSGKAVSDSVAGATIETSSVESGADRQPPTIYITTPKGAVRLVKETDTLNVQGLVADNSGTVASVSVNGEPASLSPATGGRTLAHTDEADSSAPGEKSVAFERTVTIGPATQAVVVEAKDKAGNFTRLILPVRRREAAVSQQFKGRKYAVVIGVSKYKFLGDGLNNLAYADADARSIREFLQKPQGGNFSANDILYLENDQATILSVRSALQRFLPRAGPDDLIFLFIAGHGSPDPYAPGNLYFLMHDTKVADMPGTALPMSELQQMLDNSVRAQRIVVFVDACHSAGISGTTLVTGGRQLVQTENNIFNLYAANLFREAGRAVLTSSDVNEISRESDKWGGGHGIFTWALLEGLRGEADTNNDHIITAGELFDFVSNRVRIETAFRQNPRALPGLNKDFPLAVAKPAE